MQNGDTTKLSVVELQTVNYFSLIQNDLFSLSDAAYQYDEIGHSKADKAWDKVNDLMYLQVYLEIVSLSIRTDIANSSNPCGDPDITYQKYDNKFKLNCIKNHFRCLGINPEPLFSSYGINDPLNGGIAYMSLEEGDCSIFEIL
jgi:hypothetical protein